MRLGIFGGSFDPVHLGHLFMAECCRESCALDRVLFVPAAISPHKQGSQPTDPNDRIEMLKLAIGGHEAFELSTIELDRGGVSYTVDTLAELLTQRPGAELFLLIGGDSLQQFRTWYLPDRICQLATLVAVGRAGSPKPDLTVLADITTPAQLAQMQRVQFEMPLVQFSSTEIRRRVAAGLSIRYRTPRAVEEYIRHRELYQDES
jgi:nicotinate-nucleotide adenylyltransferase